MHKRKLILQFLYKLKIKIKFNKNKFINNFNYIIFAICTTYIVILQIKKYKLKYLSININF